jgi:multidrug efflux pump subunit AcrA (membrane-fusion protein)
MSTLATQLPARRAELVIRPLGERGRYVVKDPASGKYFELGEEEHFLLLQLDGQCEAIDVCAAFDQKFGQPLGEEELADFVDMARGQGLLKISDVGTNGLPGIADSNTQRPESFNPQSAIRNPQSKQSILYWRKSIFNPDALFDWLEPKIRFVWTGGFFLFSAGCIMLSALVLWTNSHELAASFQNALRWDTAFWAWLVLMIVTTLHEFAHGLTCKHHGGELREIGFLLMYFMPCFYCNVSDAWLFREKSKRLWVTFAGGYFELFLWSLAVFVWRLTVPGSWPNYLAFVVVASCGIGTLFNLNPLIKLDGYYLLSDWLEIPNLQERGVNRFKAELRRALWGATQPGPEPRSRALFTYGLASWLYSLVFLSLALWGMLWFLGERWGVVGMSAVTLLGLVSSRAMLKDTSSGEVRQMLTQRQRRLAVWLLVVAGAIALMALVQIDDRASGKFAVRPAVRVELRAPVAGFLKNIYYDEGDQVASGTVVARLDIPDLLSRLSQRQAEARASRAQLRLLEAGPRPVEVDQQNDRVQRAKEWRDLARQDVEKMRAAWHDDLARLDTQIAACDAELDVAKDNYERVETLVRQKALTLADYHEARGRYRVSLAHLRQAQAEKRARQSTGILAAETELARRERELAEADASLKFLQEGTRPEEIDAERARLARVEEEITYLEQLQQRLTVTSPAAGTITTARLKERSGQYVRDGELICLVEQPSAMEAEVSLAEQDAARIRTNQPVRLKARAQPFKTFETKVTRVAPAAGAGEVQSTVMVYCDLDNHSAELRPGMTGYARIYTGRRPIGEILLHRLLRFVRTEFWW